MARIALGCDHGGYPLKVHVFQFLEQAGHVVVDKGTHSDDPVDYPIYAELVAESVVSRECELGILICGSGVGVCVAANKIAGIRAGLCHDSFTARQSREDDDANVLCLGARVLGYGQALDIVRIWLGASFSGAERHVRRLRMVSELETRGLMVSAKRSNPHSGNLENS